MTAFYPVFLHVRGRRCVVIGGSTEAEDKVTRLQAAGARVVVVSADVTKAIQELASCRAVEWRRRPYRHGDLKAAFLAIASPDVRSLNPDLWREAEEEKVLLNSIDDTVHCHFIAPAIHQEGDITVAISTGGKAPALAVRLRDWIATMIGREHAALVALLGELRVEVRRRFSDFGARKALWYRLVDSEAIEHLRDGNVAAARAHLLSLISEASAPHYEAVGEAEPLPATDSNRHISDASS